MSRILAILASVAIPAAALLLWAVYGAGTTEQPPAAPAAPVVPVVRDDAAPPATAEVVAAGRRELVAARTAVLPALPAQGLRGLVIDADNQALVGIDVHLLESAGNDPLSLPAQQQRRQAFGALASARSAADGTFAIGLPSVQDKVYELFLVSSRHAITRLGDLRLLAGEWHELGAITMVPGTVVRGRVTVAGHADIPVPHATVTIEAGSAFDDAALRSLPGRGQGLSTTVDANGYYELRHAPIRGAVRVTAIAPGFARLGRQNIELTAGQPVQVDFALQPGASIAGQVVAADGTAIAGARVEAAATHVPGNPFVVTSDERGHFELHGLLPGKHRVRSSAAGFEFEATPSDPGVDTGRTDLRLTMVPRSSVRVRVLTPGGTVVRSYRLGLRRYFEANNGQIGTVVDVPEQRVRLDGQTDFAVLANVPTGVFVCQVEADGYAKTLSVAFACGRRADAVAAPVLDVVLHLGGRLRGMVVDENDIPLAGASIATQPDGVSPDNPLYKLVAGNLAERITSMQVTTAADGAFVLPSLAHANYQLNVEHPEACRVFVTGLVIDRDGEQELPKIRLPIGASVVGRATIAGRVAGQIKVVLSTAPSEAEIEPIRLETITNANGEFRLPRRVPPGAYELRAAVVGTSEPDAQIFHQLLQLQRSATTVVILPGQRLAERDIDLPADH